MTQPNHDHESDLDVTEVFSTDEYDDARPEYDGLQLDRQDRAALRRVRGLSTELEDITEVEYRQLRLERVVLVGVWTDGTVEEAESSLRELAALAETAGLAGARRPDPATGQAGCGHLHRLRQGP